MADLFTRLGARALGRPGGTLAPRPGFSFDSTDGFVEVSTPWPAGEEPTPASSIAAVERLSEVDGEARPVGPRGYAPVPVAPGAPTAAATHATVEAPAPPPAEPAGPAATVIPPRPVAPERHLPTASPTVDVHDGKAVTVRRDPAERVVRISIGRIEVRAPAAASPTAPPASPAAREGTREQTRAAAAPSGPDLAAYLRGERGWVR